MVLIFSLTKSQSLTVLFTTFYLRIFLATSCATVLAADNHGQPETLHRSTSGQQCSRNQELVWLPSAINTSTGKQSDPVRGAGFLDLSGDGSTIATGHSYNDINVYQRNEKNEFIQLGQTLDVEMKLDRGSKQELGRRSFSFSFNGRIVAIEGFQSNGHHFVKMFEYNEEADYWNQLGQDVTAEKNANDFFGKSVSISDDGHTVAVGTKSQNAKVYHYRKGIWKLKGSILVGNDVNFGQIVHLSGDGSILAICAKHYVKVFKFDAERQEWSGHGNTLGYFGSGSNWRKAVSMSRDGSTIAMAGTRLYTDELQVFRLNPASSLWEQIGDGIRVSSWYLVDFAFRLSGDGNILVVGDAENDDIAENAGRVQVYQLQLDDHEEERDSSSITEEGHWKQLGGDLFSIDGDEADVQHWFGSSVAVSHDGKTVVASSSHAVSSIADSASYRTRVFSLTCDGGPTTWTHIVFLCVCLLVGGGMVAASIAVARRTTMKRLRPSVNNSKKDQTSTSKNDSDMDTTAHEFPIPSQPCNIKYIHCPDEVGLDVEKNRMN